jgi:hypothetical protein
MFHSPPPDSRVHVLVAISYRLIWSFDSAVVSVRDWKALFGLHDFLSRPLLIPSAFLARFIISIIAVIVHNNCLPLPASPLCVTSFSHVTIFLLRSFLLRYPSFYLAVFEYLSWLSEMSSPSTGGAGAFFVPILELPGMCLSRDLSPQSITSPIQADVL